MNFDLEDATILRVVHGSHLYGTNIEGSDRDEKGVCIPPIEYFFGFASKFEQHESKDPDCAVYDIRKFVSLAANCNPNILEILFVPDECILKITPAGRELRGYSKLFLSKRAVDSFSGYAAQQLKRIRTHKGWLLNPPKGLPSRADFELPDAGKAIPADMMGGIESLILKGATFSGEVLELVDREKRYAKAVDNWHSYQNWKASRNEKRAELEAKFGYDTKHAMHLVRLLRMCSEILNGQGVIVRRPDAEELVSIRRGAWSYDRLIGWAEGAEAGNREAAKVSTLPDRPNVKLLDEICVDLVSEFHTGEPMAGIRRLE